MSTLLPLSSLGQRICIIGPSNSGKSTFALALSHALNLPVIHLDQLYHQPKTHWVPRPFEEFVNLHEQAVQQSQWIIEGNYTRCLEPRLARATGLILLDIPIPLAVLRYVRRCYSRTPRQGGLKEGKDHVTLDMLHYILWQTPRKRRANREMFDRLLLPKLLLDTPARMQAAYREWGLTS